MANENHASYAKVGFTVFVGIAAIVGTLIYIGGMRGRSTEMLIETCYDKPVSGLSVGSDVNFRGVKVGEVREIDFIGNKYEVKGADNSRIYILMAIDRKRMGRNAEIGDDEGRTYVETLVSRLGLRATVTASGITGMSRIECDFYPGMSEADTPSISWKPQHIYVPPKVSLLDSFSDSATRVMNQINKMDLNAAWSNVNASVEAVAHMTDSVKVMVETRQADIERLMEDVSATFGSVKELVSELKDNPSLLIRERVRERLPETE